MSDLRKCCSDENLSTVPRSFFYPSFLSVSVKRCEKITKDVDQVVAHSTYYVTKQPLAPCDIISNVPAINRHGVFSMYTLLHR